MAKASNEKPRNPLVRIGAYLRGVVNELRRVVWPGRPEVISSSIVVIVTLLFFIAFTFVVDYLATTAVGLVARIGG